MGFTQDLARQTAELRARIHDMPFNRELAAGSLSADVFRGYIVQDAHYLEGFARALAAVAAKAPGPEEIAQLAGSSHGAIKAERTLHAHYMALFGVSDAQFRNAETSAACDHYVSFLLRVALVGDFAEGVAALLPCFWIYRDVGQRIAADAKPDNPFAAWIDTYASEEFNQGVERMLALTDRVGAAADAASRDRMHRAFARSCWHEWQFWDSAYHRRGWPIAS
ncbi:thiaminase II [Falsirhodobacter xinxiangensis]|uniref:thiaminase II n=1 Tax=Falsirhodobacter xinxiangensis TaxID=2530049 RepID=UPI00145ADFBD|nr:thiaminase II [Rhodobacter xinxiangensis]